MNTPLGQFRIWYNGEHDKLFTRYVRWMQGFRNKIICLFDRSIQRINDNTVILSTSNSKNTPSGRVVLLKNFSDQGFEFYTNYDSKKGHDLAENPQAEMLFFWPYPLRQIRISGKIIKVSREKSQAYWNSRPRESRVSGFASSQSQSIESFQALKQKVAGVRDEFKGKDIPCPENWGGYLLVPDYFEFWQGKLNRLHERTYYQLSDGKWTHGYLQP